MQQEETFRANAAEAVIAAIRPSHGYCVAAE